MKTGLYDFDLRRNQLRVFDGKASVNDGGKDVDVKGGHELNLASGSSLKRLKFDKKSYEEGDFYRWSSLRSAYLAEANVDAASMYTGDYWGAWGWAGWDWDPWFDAYTFLPGDGIWYSPFGWGFYSPWWVYDAPFFGYGLGYRYGYAGGRYFHHFGNYRDWESHSPYISSNSYSHGIYRGPGSTGGGFHSGPRMAGARGFGGSRGGSFHGECFHGVASTEAAASTVGVAAAFTAVGEAAAATAAANAKWFKTCGAAAAGQEKSSRLPAPPAITFGRRTGCPASFFSTEAQRAF